MQIRLATVEDLHGMGTAAKAFYAASSFLRDFELSRFVQTWTNLIETGIGVIFLAEDDTHIVGAIGGTAYPDPNSFRLVAAEWFWFVESGYRGIAGIKLYREFELWAKKRGAVEIQMIHLSDSMPGKLERFYKNLGFVPAETRYVKAL